jgi:hypothetical protein
VVLSPFMGIGSEGVTALKLGRKFIGIELKESYWRQACMDELLRDPFIKGYLEARKQWTTPTTGEVKP